MEADLIDREINLRDFQSPALYNIEDMNRCSNQRLRTLQLWQ